MSTVGELSIIQGNNHKIFVIDPEERTLLYVKKILNTIVEDMQIELFDDASSGFKKAHSDLPDLIIVNCKMPKINTIDCIKELRKDTDCRNIPIIVTVTEDDVVNRNAAFYAGANDFLYNPIDFCECTIRCHQLLSMRQQYMALHTHSLSIEEQMKKIKQEMLVNHIDGMARLSKAGEYKNNISGAKLVRMGRIANIIAEEMGLDTVRRKNLEQASTIHDIGKLGIPDRILTKDGPLSKAEFEIIKTHTQIGYQILTNSSSPYCQMGSIIAIQHHEKFDGSGYPNKLKGEEISIEARITTVADVFDALLSERPYKKPWALSEAYKYIEYNSNTHFDPQCVNAFFAKQDLITQLVDADIMY